MKRVSKVRGSAKHRTAAEGSFQQVRLMERNREHKESLVLDYRKPWTPRQGIDIDPLESRETLNILEMNNDVIKYHFRKVRLLFVYVMEELEMVG